MQGGQYSRMVERHSSAVEWLVYLLVVRLWWKQKGKAETIKKTIVDLRTLTLPSEFWLLGQFVGAEMLLLPHTISTRR